VGEASIPNLMAKGNGVAFWNRLGVRLPHHATQQYSIKFRRILKM